MILVLLPKCSTNTPVNTINEIQDVEKQIALIPQSQSLELFNTLDIAKSYDSILELKVNFNLRKKYEFSKSYSLFPKVIHIEIDFSAKELSLNEETRENALKEITQLDFTIYKNLKAISLSGYDKEFLDVLIEKIKVLPKIELLTLNLKPSSHLFWNRKQTIEELSVLPETFCLLNINTLKITGKRSDLANPDQLSTQAAPFYASITLPSCFTNDTKISKIIYEQEISQKLKEKDFQQFRLYKKGKSEQGKQTDQLFQDRTVKSMANHTSFIQNLLRVKSAKEIVLTNAFIDSIPSSIEDLKKLKQLTILNSEVNYFPRNIGNLTQLETLKIFNNTTNVSFETNILGLINLKKIVFVNTGLSNGFPNFSDAKKLEQLIFLDKKTVNEMPTFLNDQQYLKTLIWRYSNIQEVLDGLNKSPLNIVNIDNNKITQIDDILNAAEKASYFSYDINDIPFEKRKVYNDRIYSNGQLLETDTNKKKVDALYELREIPFVTKENIYTKEYSAKQNTVINKLNRLDEYTPIKRSDLKKDKLFSAIKNEEIYGTISFEIGANGSKVFLDEELKLLESYFDLIEENNLEPLHVFKFNNYYEHNRKENIPVQEFTIEDIRDLGEYTIVYEGYEYIDYSNRVTSGNFDYGKLKHLRKASITSQEEINNIVKVKGLRFLEVKNIEEIKSIPECFCELKELDSIYIRDPKRDKFKEEYIYIRDEIMGESVSIQNIDAIMKVYKKSEEFTLVELKEIEKEYRKRLALRKEMETFRDREIFEYSHIKFPNCMKKMKFKQVRYSGMVQKY